MIYSRNELKKLILADYGRIDEKLLKRVQDGIENSEFVSKE
jgi:hypothetical protein